MNLVERDYLIMNLCYDFGFCLGRQIRSLAGFSGQRATDRRLKKLCDAELIERKRILYGVPGLYTLTDQGKQVIGKSKRPSKIRIEQIYHSIDVVDSVDYFIKKYGIPFEQIKSEKVLHSIDGFQTRKHRPDFAFQHNEKSFCVEVELTLKARDRLENNLKNNFLDYDYQIWIVSDEQPKIVNIIAQNRATYPNIKLMSIKEIHEYVKNNHAE